MELGVWTKVQFFFSEHTLDLNRRELHRGPDLIAVEPQVFDLLTYLVQNRDRVVTKENLIEVVWRGRIVSDSTVASRINAARKAIGDNGEEQRLIRTVARRGIRFIGEVHAGQENAARAVAGSPPPDLSRDPSPAALPHSRGCGAYSPTSRSPGDLFGSLPPGRLGVIHGRSLGISRRKRKLDACTG
jgi:DNA-binding winged helix-turn-helix (wHTH) protein